MNCIGRDYYYYKKGIHPTSPIINEHTQHDISLHEYFENLMIKLRSIEAVAGDLEDVFIFDVFKSVINNDYQIEQEVVKAVIKDVNETIPTQKTFDHITNLTSDEPTMPKSDIEILDEVFTLDSSDIVPGIDFNFYGLFESIYGYIHSSWLSIQDGFYFDQNIDIEHEKFSYYKQMARSTNSSQYFIILGNFYILGDQEMGIKPDKAVAIQYFKQAAVRGSQVGLYNLAILYQDIDPSLAAEYMTQ